MFCSEFNKISNFIFMIFVCLMYSMCAMPLKTIYFKLCIYCTQKIPICSTFLTLQYSFFYFPQHFFFLSIFLNSYSFFYFPQHLLFFFFFLNIYTFFYFPQHLFIFLVSSTFICINHKNVFHY